MKGQNGGYQKDVDVNERFLMRHNSFSTFNYFGCCSKDMPSDLSTSQVSKNHTGKISIKNLLKKDADLNHSNYSIHAILTNLQQKSAIQVNKPHVKNPRITQMSNMSEIQNISRSESTILKIPHKINLKNRRNERQIHTYNNNHTVVRPNQINIYGKIDYLRPEPIIFDKERKQEPFRGVGQHVQQRKLFENQLKLDKIPKNNQQQWKDQRNIQEKYPVLPKPSNFRSDFSFGNQQKNAFFNKFASLKHIQSLRPLKQQRKEILQGQNTNKPLFLNNNKQKLFDIIRDAQLVLNEQESFYQSQMSEVLENHQSMMSHFQQKYEDSRNFMKKF